MTYTRKIYGFCVAVLCTFFVIGCSAVKETSDIAFELDLSTIFSADSGARQVFDGKDNIKLNISASIYKAKDNSQTVGHGDFIKHVDEEISYPAAKTTKIEFKDLEIGESYSVSVYITTVGEETSVFNGETSFEVKAGTNVVSLTMEDSRKYPVKLSVDASGVNIPLSNFYYSYILFKVDNGKGANYYGFTKITEDNKASVRHTFNNYNVLQKTTAKVFYVITTEEISWANADLNDNDTNTMETELDALTYTVLKESDSKIYYVVPDKVVNLGLNDSIKVSQSLITSGLALPVITAESDNDEICTITTADGPAKITINTNATVAPSVTFTASSIDNSNNPYNDVLYAWFLNGNVVVDNSGDPITTDYIEVTLSGNNDIQKTDDPLEPKINTLMLIVSKDSEMQSAIWQFTVVEK